MNKATIFFDRDGTLIKDKHFLSNPDDIELYPDTLSALKMVRNLDLHIVIISNQSGVARGFFTEEDVQICNDRLCRIFEENQIPIAGVYYCPNHAEAVIPKYRENLECRKPSTAMVSKALQDIPIELSRSFIVGDKLSDMELAKNLGIPGILVLTGYGQETLQKIENPFFHVSQNLTEAMQIVMRLSNETP